MNDTINGALTNWGAGGLSLGASFAVTLYVCKQFGAGVRWIIEYFTGRIDRREASVEEADKELDRRKDSLIDKMEGQLTSLLNRVTVAEAALAECIRKHAESDAKVLHLEALLLAKGEIKQQAALIIAADKLEAKSG